MSHIDPDDLPVTMMQQAVTPTAVMVSGRGSNLRAILEAHRERRLPCANVSLVICDEPEAGALAVAAEFGVETAVFPRADFASAAEHEAAIAKCLKDHYIRFVVLAGYMRVLSEEFVRKYAGAIINIHPSLLPSFPGLEAPKQAVRHGVRLSGCTVHYVNEQVDGGPIILQRAVPVFEGDDAAELAARILAEEHRLLPYAIDLHTRGRLAIEKNRVRIRPGDTSFPEEEEKLSSQYFPLLLATENAHKVEEIKSILRGLPLHFVTLREFAEMTMPEEDADSYLGNARIKARTWAIRTKMWVLADDSGLEVQALNGRPGTHSARYAPTNDERLAKLLRELDGIPAEERGAQFVCVTVLRGPAGQEFATEGKLEGRIGAAARGEGGFGYDPLFQPDGHEEKHLAELDAAVKNRISHRARALYLLRPFLEKLVRGELN